MQGDNIRVNGNAMSWGSIIIKCEGERLEGFDSIAYAHSRTREKGRGTGRHQAPGRRSRGEYDTEPVKLRGFASSVTALLQFLADANDGVNFGDTEFQIIVQAVESDELPLDVAVYRCVVTKVSATFESGPGLLKKELEIDCMKIVENGLTLFDGSEGSP